VLDISHPVPIFLIGRRWMTALRWGLTLVLLGIIVCITLQGLAKPDPYIRLVEELPGRATYGASLFALNCADCHGIEGNGKVGPSLRNLQTRRSDTFIIHQVTSGQTPPMPQFQPSPQEMADLLAYLKSL
jgi:mono/diheme cytochrome c family protein